MINFQEFRAKVSEYFHFLIVEFGFSLDEEIERGNIFFELRFRDERKVISISYEKIEDYLQVIIYLLDDNEFPQYDDESRVFHLKQLTKVMFAKISANEIRQNNSFFKEFKTKNKFETSLLNGSKELRLLLRHLPTIFVE